MQSHFGKTDGQGPLGHRCKCQSPRSAHRNGLRLRSGQKPKSRRSTKNACVPAQANHAGPMSPHPTRNKPCVNTTAHTPNGRRQVPAGSQRLYATVGSRPHKRAIAMPVNPLIGPPPALGEKVSEGQQKHHMARQETDDAKEKSRIPRKGQGDVPHPAASHGRPNAVAQCHVQIAARQRQPQTQGQQRQNQPLGRDRAPPSIPWAPTLIRHPASSVKPKASRSKQCQHHGQQRRIHRAVTPHRWLLRWS